MRERVNTKRYKLRNGLSAPFYNPLASHFPLVQGIGQILHLNISLSSCFRRNSSFYEIKKEKRGLYWGSLRCWQRRCKLDCFRVLLIQVNQVCSPQVMCLVFCILCFSLRLVTPVLQFIQLQVSHRPD